MLGWELEPSDLLVFASGALLAYTVLKLKGYFSMMIDNLVAAVNSLEAAGQGLMAAADAIKARSVAADDGGVALQVQVDRINGIATILTQATAKMQG